VRDTTGRPIAAFSMRARAPLFDVAPFTLAGRMVGDNEAEVFAVTPQGGVAVEARARLG
jgi:3-methylfumaryl-CoA hydratase